MSQLTAIQQEFVDALGLDNRGIPRNLPTREQKSNTVYMNNGRSYPLAMVQHIGMEKFVRVVK